MGLEFFKVYHSYLKGLDPLNDAECGRLLKACIQYSMTGEAPELRGNERFLFPSWQSQIDREKSEYAEACKKEREKKRRKRMSPCVPGDKGGQWGTEGDSGGHQGTPPPSLSSPPTPPVSISPTPKEKPPKGGKKKVPPTLDEVRAYCLERRNGIDPQAFMDFYEARGWKYGQGRPVVDWKACVRTWEHRRREEGGQDEQRYFTPADIPGN